MSADGAVVTLTMQNVAVVDQPRWPAIDASATPATMNFRMVWRSTGEPLVYENAAKHFRFSGTHATCQIEASVVVPSLGFSWKSDPLETSQSAFAVIGQEANGRYFDE